MINYKIENHTVIGKMKQQFPEFLTMLSMFHIIVIGK